MSCYIKFHGWAGEDLNGTTARFAKIFRMDSGKASRAMRRIISNEDWQFQWPISDDQAKLAHSYCRWLGFDLKLIPTKQFFQPNKNNNEALSSSLAKPTKFAPELLNQLVELTANLSNAFTIALYKINLSGKTLTLRHYISLSTNFNPEIKIGFGKGLIGMVAKNKKILVEENYKNRSIKFDFYEAKENLKSYLITPVIHENLEGVLFIDSKESYNFSIKQKKILSGLANQMAWHLNHERIFSLTNNSKYS
jgi:putative methionine-R-sulfoxide reductase with GAF domain